jgi:hypothetical protein
MNAMTWHVLKQSPVVVLAAFPPLEAYEDAGGTYSDAGNAGDDCSREEFVAALLLVEQDGSELVTADPCDHPDLFPPGTFWRDSVTGCTLLRAWPECMPSIVRGSGSQDPYAAMYAAAEQIDPDVPERALVAALCYVGARYVEAAKAQEVSDRLEALMQSISGEYRLADVICAYLFHLDRIYENASAEFRRRHQRGHQ